MAQRPFLSPRYKGQHPQMTLAGLRLQRSALSLHSNLRCERQTLIQTGPDVTASGVLTLPGPSSRWAHVRSAQLAQSVKIPCRIAEEGDFVRRRGAGCQPLEGVPVDGVGARDLVHGEVALEHATLWAERFDAGTCIGQVFGRGRALAVMEFEERRRASTRSGSRRGSYPRAARLTSSTSAGSKAPPSAGPAPTSSTIA